MIWTGIILGLAVIGAGELTSLFVEEGLCEKPRKRDVSKTGRGYAAALGSSWFPFNKRAMPLVCANFSIIAIVCVIFGYFCCQASLECFLAFSITCFVVFVVPSISKFWCITRKERNNNLKKLDEYDKKSYTYALITGVVMFFAIFFTNFYLSGIQINPTSEVVQAQIEAISKRGTKYNTEIKVDGLVYVFNTETIYNEFKAHNGESVEVEITQYQSFYGDDCVEIHLYNE